MTTRTSGIKRLLGVQLLAAFAQASGAAQLGALLLVVGQNRSTDAYVTLFTASQLAGSIIITGTLQPLALSNPEFSGWRRWAAIGVGVNVLAVAVTTGLLLVLDYRPSVVFPIAALIAISGTLAVIAGSLAVERAVIGAPGLLAGLTIAPNLLATALLVAASSGQLTWMCTGLLAGNILIAGWSLLRRPDRDRSTPSGGAEIRASQHRRLDSWGLVGSSAIGATGPFGLQAATASFPEGQATLLAVFSRIGAGLIGVGVTAYTYAVTDWRRRDEAPLRVVSFSAVMAQFAAVAAIGLLLFLHVDVDWITGLLATIWILSAASQATAARALQLVGRYEPFRQMALPSLVFYPAAAWMLIAVSQTATAYFIALAVIAAFANTFFLHSLGWKREVSWAAASVALSGVCVAWSVLV